MDDDGVDNLRAEVKSEVDAAVEDAWNAPDPEPESAVEHVFAIRRPEEPTEGGDAQASGEDEMLETTGGEATPAESPAEEV